MEGIQKRKLNRLAKDIWKWDEQRNLWIFASYIRSEDNIIADSEFRENWNAKQNLGCQEPRLTNFHKHLESQKLISLLAEQTQSAKYTCLGKRILSCNQCIHNRLVFIFFLCVPTFLDNPKSIKKDSVRGIKIVPKWPFQAWLCMTMFEFEPIVFESNLNLLRSLNKEPHPLWKHLTPVDGTLSGRRSR